MTSIRHVPIACIGCRSRIPAKSAWSRDGAAFRCQSCSAGGPGKLARLIRRRYPNTAIGVLYVTVAVAALRFPPVRKTGELMLGLLAVAIAVVAMEHVSRLRR